jgi:deoxyribodipyrimidine photo-lyase
MTLIWWLRRDVRLDDNTALGGAFSQSDGAVIPVFILDRAILTSSTTGAARVHFLSHARRNVRFRRQLRAALRTRACKRAGRVHPRTVDHAQICR